MPLQTLVDALLQATASVSTTIGKDDRLMDGNDQEKLQMLETYMAMQGAGGDAEIQPAADAPLPTRAEDVDRFMAELVRAC